MSSRRKRTSSPGGLLATLLVFLTLFGVAVVFVLPWTRGTGAPPGLRPPVRVPDPPARNPIEAVLTSDPPAERKDGTALLLLVDSSGSMDDRVQDSKGELRKKMDIARRAVASLVEQAQTFSRKHPEIPIAVGIDEFSVRSREPSSRMVVPLGPPDAADATARLARVQPKGGTPIGDAVIEAKLRLDRSGFRKTHILVITDGQNTNGYAPADVANVISRLPDDRRSSLYFIAFDVAASHFNATRDAGALVLGASNEQELQQTLGYVLTGKILAEQIPGK